jgi:5-methylcytosine-specific restriction endonuclease McrA
MSRPDLVTYYPIIFPNRRDPSGRQLCRWCGKPIVKTKGRRRRLYCDDECRRLTYLALSWQAARRAAYDRDGGRCRICGREVRLGDAPEPEYSKPQAEIHHVIRPEQLRKAAAEATGSIEDPQLRRHWFCKTYALLYLDVNNLMTLCRSPCHDQAHAAAAYFPNCEKLRE